MFKKICRVKLFSIVRMSAALLSAMAVGFAVQAATVTGVLSEGNTKLTVTVAAAGEATFDPSLLNANLATVTELVKDGDGILDVPANAGFSSYVGAVTVKAGKYVYHDNSGFGSTAEASSNAYITVKTGGAIVAKEDVKGTDFSLRYRKVKLGGTGPDTKGAWQFDMLESRNAMCLCLDLEADAKLALISSCYIDQSGISGKEEYSVINLNGHELELALHGRQITLNRARVTGGGGRLKLTSDVSSMCVLKLQNYRADCWFGTSAEDLTVVPTGKTSVLLNGQDQVVKARMEPSVDNIAAIRVGGRFNGVVSTNYHCWAGPVDFGSSWQQLGIQTYDPVTVEGVQYYHNTLTLSGKVSGSNPIFVYRASAALTERHFHLTNPDNDFIGGLAVSDVDAFLWANGAVPDAGGDLFLTNATLHLKSAYHALPKIRAHGACVIDGTLGSTRGIVKTGGGELEIRGQYRTDLLEVEEGSVRLSTAGDASLYAGLCEGVGYYSSATDSQIVDCRGGYAYRQGVSTDLPRLRSSYGDVFRRPVDQTWVTDREVKRFLITYSGYIWNNSATNVHWTFAGNVGNIATVKIDGTELFWMNNTSETKWGTIELTPGPHTIYIGNEGKINDGGVNKSAKNMDPDWDKMGLQWDPLGRDSNLKANYQPLVDPGDGSLLTWCIPGEEADYPVADTYVFNRVAEKPGRTMGKVGDIRSMTFAANTSLDASGSAVTLKDLSGLPTIDNCSLLTVSNSWTVSGVEIASGKKLAVAKLAFAGTPTLVVDGGKALKLGRPYVLATVTDEAGVVGLPTPACDDYDIRYDETTKSLLLTRARGTGLILTIR